MIFENIDIITVLPEIILAIFSVLALFLAGVSKKLSYKTMVAFAVLALTTVILLLLNQDKSTVTAFTGLFISDAFTNYMKIFLSLASILTLLMSGHYLRIHASDKKEYPVLILFASLGMMTLLSANNLIVLYLGLELTALPLYVLSAFNENDKKSAEAGVKYLICGAFSTAIFLYGASLIYGYTGALDYGDIAVTLSVATEDVYMTGSIFGLVMIITALAFKIGLAPFHMWVPDIFEGAPTPSAIFFSIAPKLVLLALLGRLLVIPFYGLAHIWQNIVIVLAILSMVYGSVAALVQTNIKRLLGYSSIVHMGYALIGLACVSDIGIQALMIYITIYSLMIVGAFAVVLLMQKKGQMVEQISDLSGWWKTRPHTAFVMAIIMLSMAGLPPLAGFFGKMLILQAAIDAGMVYLAIIGILASVVAAYYYLYVIKVMYFDKTSAKLDKLGDRFILFVVNLSAVIAIVFPFVILEGVVDMVRIAVGVFFR